MCLIVNRDSLCLARDPVSILMLDAIFIHGASGGKQIREDCLHMRSVIWVNAGISIEINIFPGFKSQTVKVGAIAIQMSSMYVCEQNYILRHFNNCAIFFLGGA